MTHEANDFAAAHQRARERGTAGPVYPVVRFLVTPPLRVWFRLSVAGREHVPEEGAAIIAPNHKSFLDAFFVGLSTPRRVRFMAKTELFRGPLLGGLFLRLGAFPVRRGESDAEAIETARIVLEQGELLVMFPEGTRVEDPGALGTPHHGAGRLALEAGVPLVPAAIAGTAHLWLGPIPKPRHVRVAFVAPIDPAHLGNHPDAVHALVDDELWPAVQHEYGRQLARPGLILAGLAAIGIGGGLVARRQARSTPRVIGVVEPLKLRRRKRRQGWKARLRFPRRRR